MIKKIFGMMLFAVMIFLAQNVSAEPDISIIAHVQDVGWKPPVGNGGIAGAIGEGRRLEALVIQCEGIEYRAHVQDIGWEDWVSDGQVAGTVGEGLRMEAIRIRLRGRYADRYDVRYRAYVHKIGWQGWVSNGEVAGTVGEGLRMEAIQIELVSKSSGRYYDDDDYYSRDRYDDYDRDRYRHGRNRRDYDDYSW